MITNTFRYPTFKYSGLISEDDPLHATLPVEIADLAELVSESSTGLLEHFERAGIVLAPHYVTVGRRKIPQWSPTVRGEVRGFDPAHDCAGNFMSYKFLPNNNCYNYACNIATNSFAQPGRMHGISLLNNKVLDPSQLLKGAEEDGLIYVGSDSFSVDQVARLRPTERGHFVALLISDPDKTVQSKRDFWKGDFHFVRCDNDECTSWSQKDGPDQVVNFDFRGMSIIDPRKANWEANQGPTKLGGGGSAFLVSYTFHAWMFVPYGRVEII